MRLIHMIADSGWECLVFTSDTKKDAPAEDFVSSKDAHRPGFKAAFDGDIELPAQFCPGDGDAFEHESE